MKIGLAPTMDLMARLPGLPTGLSVEVAHCATRIACSISSRLGALNTCIPRSLVFGTLISDRPGVALHIGFRTPNPQSIHAVDGHAWVSLNGNNVLDERTDEDLVESTRIEIHRG